MTGLEQPVHRAVRDHRDPRRVQVLGEDPLEPGDHARLDVHRIAAQGVSDDDRRRVHPALTM